MSRTVHGAAKSEFWEMHTQVMWCWTEERSTSVKLRFSKCLHFMAEETKKNFNNPPQNILLHCGPGIPGKRLLTSKANLFIP